MKPKTLSETLFDVIPRNDEQWLEPPRLWWKTSSFTFHTAAARRGICYSASLPTLAVLLYQTTETYEMNITM